MKTILSILVCAQFMTSVAWGRSQAAPVKEVKIPEMGKPIENPPAPKLEVVEQPVAPFIEDPSDFNSKTARGQMPFVIGMNYSFLDTWIPNKLGAQFAYNRSESSTWEMEYLRGSISVPAGFLDIGSITNQRLSLLHRSFSSRNSFNFFWGLVYESLEAKLGSDLLASAGASAASVELLKISTLGISWGMGNRWSIHRNLTFGIDWLAINIPVTTLESDTDFLKYSNDPEDRDDVQDVVDAVEKLPTISILKLQLAYTF